jgi:hypothetical protein
MISFVVLMPKEKKKTGKTTAGVPRQRARGKVRLTAAPARIALVTKL